MAMDRCSMARSALAPLVHGLQMPALAEAAFQLAYERALGTSSFWHPFIETLPKVPPSLPFWKHVPKCLEGTPVLLMANKLLLHRQNLWAEYVQPLVAKHDSLRGLDITMESFVWSCGIIRCVMCARLQLNPMVYSSRQHPGGLVPVIDLFNHRTSGGIAEAGKP